jgi:hypothetical protein
MIAASLGPDTLREGPSAILGHPSLFLRLRGTQPQQPPGKRDSSRHAWNVVSRDL